MTLNTGILTTFLFSKMQMITKVLLQICLNLNSTRHQVALAYIDILTIINYPNSPIDET